MKLSTTSIIGALLASSAIAQRDVTFTITCLGPQCTDNPPTTVRIPSSFSVPGGIPRTTTTTPTRPSSTSSSRAQPPQSSTLRTSTVRPPSSRSTVQPPPTTKLPPTKTSSVKPPPVTKTTGEEIGPSSTRCPVPLYYQCGGWYDGKPWTGCTKCVSGAKCIWQNDWYYQCVADDE